MQERVSSRSHIAMYPSKKGVRALTGACNLTGLRIRTPLYQLHVTLGIGYLPLLAGDEQSFGAGEALVITEVGSFKSAWALKLTPVYPDAFYPRLYRLRDRYGNTDRTPNLHMSIAGCKTHPEFSAELVAARSNLIGLRIDFDRIAIEQYKYGSNHARKMDVHQVRISDTRR